MHYNDSSLRVRMFHKLLAVALSVLLSIAMVPVVSLQAAFATSEGEDILAVDEGVIDDSLQGEGNSPDDDEASASVLDGEDIAMDEEAEGKALVESKDEAPAESFRFKDGRPIYGSDGEYSARSIGTNYPHSFVRYDEGHHTRSDALCGIDVSYWNGSHAAKPMINWAKVKAAGIDYAIIRSSSGFTVDDTDFAYNVKGCIANNIPFGVYHYAMATNADEANQEADHVFRMLAAAGVTPSNITYPIYYDIENSGTPNYWSYGQGVVDSIASTFINRMNKAGYKSGVYSSTSWFDGGPCGSSYINSLEYRWIAQYNSAGLQYGGFGGGGNALMNNGKGMWQFTSEGYVDGISGYVDLNYSYLGGKFEASGKATVSNVDKDGGTFRVTLCDLKSNRGIYKVEFAVWCSSRNGQDDLRWYTGTRASDGSYYADIAIKDHKGYTGAYAIHGYVSTRSGQSIGSDGSMSTSANIDVNPKQMSGPRVSSDNFTVTAEFKGGEYACATAVRISATLSSSLGAASVSSMATQGSPVWFSVTKRGNLWPGVINVHQLRAAGTYNMEVWATVNGRESKVDQASFTISSYKDPGVPMYRLYNRLTGEHLYTASTYERDVLKSGDWNYEGIGWIAASGGTPVYRLWNGNVGEHHYTTSAYERDYIVRYQGWTYEGIGWYSDGSTPLHRLYNPSWNMHHYTTSAYERDFISKYEGWNQEGVGWYGL